MRTARYSLIGVNYRIRVPSSSFFVVKKDSAQPFSVFILGRYGYLNLILPRLDKYLKVFQSDCIGFVILSCLRGLSRKRKKLFKQYQKYFAILAGYYKQAFLTVSRGHRRTIYQYGLGYKAFLYPYQQRVVFKVGRSARTYCKLPRCIYLQQGIKRHRRLIAFAPVLKQLSDFLLYVQLKKPASVYRPRKGVYFRGKFYYMKKSGKLLRKGKKK